MNYGPYGFTQNSVMPFSSESTCLTMSYDQDGRFAKPNHAMLHYSNKQNCNSSISVQQYYSRDLPNGQAPNQLTDVPTADHDASAPTTAPALDQLQYFFQCLWKTDDAVCNKPFKNAEELHGHVLNVHATSVALF